MKTLSWAILFFVSLDCGVVSGAKRPTTSLSSPLRGGATSSTSKSKGGATATTTSPKKKSKKKRKKQATAKAKQVIDEAMKEKDAAEALGDAIRDRADVLRQDALLQSIDWTVGSVGHALGATGDVIMMTKKEEGGGVQAPPTSVIANYFLKAHGGVHWLQTGCSLLACVSALGAMKMSSTQNEKWTLTLLRRCLIFAMVKHMSGLLSSASVAAKAVPKIGLTQARKWMEQIVREPVGQYVCYTSLLLLWAPKALAAAWWWPRHGWVIPLLVGPILLREVISTLMVVSDVIVLWSVGSGNQGGIVEQTLSASQAIVDGCMSLLVGPTKWRPADPAQRQAILAALVSKLSLALEAGVGAFLVLDLLLGMVFGMGGRPSWKEAMTKVLVVRLYVHFLLWTRKKRLSKLGAQVRGGAVQFPFWLLDTLYEPSKALGLEESKTKPQDSTKSMSLGETIQVGMGL
jgi:hypothetical protein